MCPEGCAETAKEPFCEMPWPRLTFYTDDKHKHYPCRVDSGKLNTNSQDDFKNKYYRYIYNM